MNSSTVVTVVIGVREIAVVTVVTGVAIVLDVRVANLVFKA